MARRYGVLNHWPCGNFSKLNFPGNCALNFAGVCKGPPSLKRLGFVIVPPPLSSSSCRLAVPVTGWDPLRLNSAGLPVPYRGTTCAWTSIG